METHFRLVHLRGDPLRSAPAQIFRRMISALLLAGASSVATAAPLSWDQPGASLEDRPAMLAALSAWRGDWGGLPLGNASGKFAGAPGALKDVAGEDLQKTWTGPDEVVIRGLRARVHWKAAQGEKFRTTLFHIVGARRVVIEDVAIIAADSDYRMYDTFHIEDADEVIVRNVYFGGPVQSYHLRIFGARRVVVDGIEVAGTGEPGERRAGGGVWIKNSASRTKKPGPGVPFDANWAQADWTVVQNGYFHDYEDADKLRNQDAINVESPGDGLIFNCVVDNWARENRVGDAAFDISYRLREAQGGKRFRIERNVFRKAHFTKTPGYGPGDDRMIWANNVYLDTHIGDYHGGWLNALVHNSFVLDGADRLYRMWEQKPDGHTLIAGNTVVSIRPLDSTYYFNDAGVREKLPLLHTDYNAYAMPVPGLWLGGKLDKATRWSDWQTLGQDRNSRNGDAASCHPELGDLLKGPPCVVPPLRLPSTYAATADLAVTRDFLGRPRPASPAAGAYEEVAPGAAGRE